MSSHDKLRDDNECQNCGHTVTGIYCGHCGQKNTETRQSFVHLVTHFAEDLTHYDSGFWKTIKYLLFRPAKLTQEYLMGKRQQYVPPVKLYIFISFVTFFLPAILPDFSGDEHHDTEAKHEAAAQQDSPVQLNLKDNKFEKDDAITVFRHTYVTMHDLEVKDAAGEINFIEYYTVKALLQLKENNVSLERAGITFVHTLPKVLFIYMPVFAFWLWLFHGKKRWYFFDHGIFTLHYFSVLLLLFTIFYVLQWLVHLVIEDPNGFFGIVGIAFMLYAFFYFFRSHSKMYGEKRYISRIKSIFLFVINIICISVTLFSALLYALFHTH